MYFLLYAYIYLHIWDKLCCIVILRKQNGVCVIHWIIYNVSLLYNYNLSIKVTFTDTNYMYIVHVTPIEESINNTL